MSIKIALAGNPNCGKTTLFNILTGSNQYVGNWPGVTVEKKEGTLKGHSDVIIQDLPGIYSLSPYSPEELVTRTYLVEEHPDAILNIVDGTNIERNLYLTTQLIELGHPVVVAVNMIDLVRKNGDIIDLEKLSRALGCVCLEISALKGEACAEAAEKAVELARNHTHSEIPHVYNGSVEHALAHIEESIEGRVASNYLRWYAIKLFERDEMVRREVGLDSELLAHIEKHIIDCEWEMDDDAESIVADQRYTWIERVIQKAVVKKAAKHSLTLSDKIDRIVTDRILALPIFAGIMFLMYAIAMGSFPFSIGTMGTDWANDVLFGEWVPNLFDSILTALGVSDWLYGLVMDGILAGVGAVLGFVPQILVLSFLLSLLEDVGYMSRVAFIMDRILRKFGLSGKSIIPMLVATGCGVPGILASRTIEQERDRKITVMTTGFIPCGAKMPIIGLFAGAVFGNSPLVAVSAFFIGVGAVVVSGVILKKFKSLAGKPAPFVMELPAYHLPSPRNVLRSTLERGWDFVKRAATIVLLSSIVLWFLQSYGFVNGGFAAVEDNNTSLLADIGKAIAWIFYPIGWMGDMAWKAAIATLTGLIAKEEVVMTFGTLYNFSGELSEAGDEIWALVAADFGPIRAYSFMIFNLLCAPCFAAIGAVRREMHDMKWTVATIAYMCLFAYAISMIVYQLGGLFTGEAEFSIFTIAAVAVLAGLLYLLLRKNRYADTKVKIGVS
ncbi:MAG: ferrous iron transport protein B [Oscillospiraceae bacterium]|nr:ferrous iron transport protein B [Oscillospiraceae bacterium]MBQ7130416.1 ferrous iron transport protein B [Oscillospiraceae bacterium]